jgi:hypothetical protein
MIGVLFGGVSDDRLDLRVTLLPCGLPWLHWQAVRSIRNAAEIPTLA